MMKKFLCFCGLLLSCQLVFSQKVETIYFNLYTDSLKKGIHNYINVEAKLNDGSYTPLDRKQIFITSSYGIWVGNNLIIDSAYNKDSIVITVVLKEDKSIQKSVTIYLKKNLTEEVLKSEEEILNSISKPRKRKDKSNFID